MFDLMPRVVLHVEHDAAVLIGYVRLHFHPGQHRNKLQVPLQTLHRIIQNDFLEYDCRT